MNTNFTPIIIFLIFLTCCFTGCGSEEKEDEASSSAPGGSSDDDTGNFDEYDDDDSVDNDVDDDATAPDDDSVNDDDDTPGPLECMLEEGFEGAIFPPTGWSVERTSPIVYFQWQRARYTAYEGYYSAAVISYVLIADELLYTNQVDLSNYSTLSVTFWNFGSYDVYYGIFDPPELSLEVSDDIQNWAPVWTFADSDWVDMEVYIGDPSDLFKEVTVNLDEYAGGEIYLGWRFKSAWSANLVGYLWGVDQIKVCGHLKE